MSNTTIPDAALSQHIIALGKTGSGKSSALRVLVERMLTAQRRVCIIDPKGDWWGLKLSASGKSAGFPVVIFGGEHGDVPINPHAGAHIAELVGTGNRPCIIDLGGMGVGERTRFFIDFAGALFRSNKSPLWLVIDEVHNFAPQGKVLDPDSGRMLHWANRLASEGRGKAITLLSASQRPQKTHKDFVTSMETLIAMRVIHPLDRAAIKDWIEGCPDREKGREVLDTLASMQKGNAWVWSPEIGFGPVRVAFPMFKTYDSFAAPTGEGHAQLRGWAEVDLEDVKTKLATVVEEAKANDPKELRRQLAELRKALAERPSETIEKIVEKIREVPVLKNGQLDRTEKFAARLEQAGEQIKGEADRLLTEAAELRRLIAPAAAPQPVAVVSRPAAVPRPAPVPRPRHVGRDDAEGLTRPQQAILDTILMLEVRGIPATRDTVARWLGIHPNGGSYGANLGTLRTDPAYLDGFTLTDRGRAAAREQETGLDAALAALPDEPKRKIIRTLIDAGRPLTRDELAEALGIHPNGGSYGANLGWLRTMGLIPERGAIAPSEALYR